MTSWALTGTSIENLADLAARFGMADRLIVTDATVEQSVVAVERVRPATSVPVLVGGRTSAETIRTALEASDGVIVGTCLRQSGRTDMPLDPDAIQEFMLAARGA